jgi:hypothetical protein
MHARKRSASVTFLPDSYALKRSRSLDGIPKGCLDVKYVQAEAQKNARKVGMAQATSSMKR